MSSFRRERNKIAAQIILPNSNDRHSLDTILTCSVSNVITTVLSNLIRTESKSHSRIESKKRVTEYRKCKS